MKELKVQFIALNVGTITQPAGRMKFQYSKEWLQNGFAISLSLPLQDDLFESPAFFEGILPEEGQRAKIARAKGVSEDNPFALLGSLAGETIGALTIPNDEKKSESNSYKKIPKEKVEAFLNQIPRNPLFAIDGEARMSLAGAQAKVSLKINGDELWIPLSDSPGTHIIKPSIRDFPDSAQNEFFCMKLAEKMGLNVAKVQLLGESSNFLSVERFDRILETDRTIQRLHQEDFCQAFGIESKRKYQREGGPHFAQIYSLIRAHFQNPVKDILELNRAVFFNFLIGNNDAHAKNFSILYREKGLSLSPLYDLLSTEIYPGLSTKMAMKIGGEYEAEKVMPYHWETFAKETEQNPTLVKNQLIKFSQDLVNTLENIQTAFPIDSKIKKLAMQKAERTTRLDQKSRG